MYSAAGDIVIVLDADTQPFTRSLGNATTDLKRSTADWNSTLQALSSSGFSRGLGQAGFALQDFTSVLSMGGNNALGRALMSTMNNVQMLGMAFGPMGAAITSVGGALGSMLIPKLLESKETVSALVAEFDEARKRSEELGKAFERNSKFGESLEKLTKPEQAQDLVERLKMEEEVIQNKMQEERRLRDKSQARARQAPKEEHPSWFGTNIPQFWAPKVQTAQDFADQKAAIDEFKKSSKELEKLQQQLNIAQYQRYDAAAKKGELEAAKFAEDSMKKALEKDKEKAKAEVAQAKERDDAIEAAQKANERRDEQRRNTARQITEQYASPFEAAQYKIEELKQNLADGTIGQDLFDKASGKVIDEFAKGQTKTDQKLGGAQAGSASAFEQIRESIRDANRTADAEQIKLLKRQADNSDSMKTSLDKLTDAPVLRVEGIA